MLHALAVVLMYILQDMFNLLPNLNQEELVRSFTVKTNDQMQAMYTLYSLVYLFLSLGFAYLLQLPLFVDPCCYCSAQSYS